MAPLPAHNPLTGSYGTSSFIHRYGGPACSRYFFGKGNFLSFVGLNVSVRPGSRTDESGGIINRTAGYSTFAFGANLNADFCYGLTKRLAVVGPLGSLGFQSSSFRLKDADLKTTTTSFGLDANTLGNRFTVGVSYTLKR